MEELIKSVLSQAILSTGGAVITGVVWLAKAMWRAQKDLNAAHEKLRDMQEELDAVKQKLQL